MLAEHVNQPDTSPAIANLENMLLSFTATISAPSRRSSLVIFFGTSVET